MKGFLILFAVMLVVSGAYAQISLGSGSYPSSVLGTDSFKVTISASTFPSLSAAANGLWDLSIVTDSTPVFYAYRVDPDTTSAQFADSNFYTLSTYSYQGNVQSSIVTAGILEYGVNVQRAGYLLSTGGSDSLFIPSQYITYSIPRTKIAFTTSYLTFWSSDYHFDLNYQVSVALASLNHAIGIVTTYVTEKDSVIGWGKMRVKDITGIPSSWFNVLQVKTNITRVDSFSLQGSYSNPFLPTLLSGLGLTQGQITKTYEQNYYRVGEVSAFANVIFTDSTYTTPSKATTHTQRLLNTGVANVGNNPGICIYPNPVTGNIVSIELPFENGSWDYELIDGSGRSVNSGALHTNSNYALLSLPATISPGIYYLKLNNNGEQIFLKPLNIAR